jgi:kynurenine formamidase
VNYRRVVRDRRERGPPSRVGGTGLENLANLDRIPRRGATIMVGLIPYEEGSGGQARIFASW